MRKGFGKIRCCGVFLMILAIFGLWGCAGDGPAPSTDAAAGEEVSLSGGLMALYRGPLNHLHGVRAGECPMYPSCSAYSEQAFRMYGPVRGWAMTMDRLMRCGRDEVRTAPRILINGRVKFYDPVPENAFSSAANRPLTDDQVPGK